jgi:rhodanese-related sulfurtransferase
MMLVILLMAAAGSSIAAQAVRNVPRITIDEVKALMASKQVLLVDVRDPQSFADGHMPGAINVPFDRIPDHVDTWKKEKRLIVTYCA